MGDTTKYRVLTLNRNPEQIAMDISLNTRPTPHPVAATGFTPATPAANAADRPALTVTDAPLSGTDAVKPISDADLDKNDALGRLFNAAFNLPPPPMPAFPS